MKKETQQPGGLRFKRHDGYRYAPNLKLQIFGGSGTNHFAAIVAPRQWYGTRLLLAPLLLAPDDKSFSLLKQETLRLRSAAVSGRNWRKDRGDFYLATALFRIYSTLFTVQIVLSLVFTLLCRWVGPAKIRDFRKWPSALLSFL